jgi:hypothetical protein
MSETSGVLRPVVLRVLRHEQLSHDDVAVMCRYLDQWMAGDFRGPDVPGLRAAVADIHTPRDLYVWLGRALDAGIDPL